MHRALALPDILVETVSHLEDEEDLAALARTSRLFLEPALDALWIRQRTFVEFLRLFPNIVVDEASNGQTYKRVRLLRPIAAADWERPSFYAHRVRRFSSLDRSLDLSETFDNLRLSMPGECIFPRLRSLHWVAPEPQNITLFLAPTLNDLSVWAGKNTTFLSILPNLAEKLHSLKSASIHGDDSLSLVPDFFSLFAQSLTCVQYLNLPTIDHDALEYLSRLPSLTSLNLQTLLRLHPSLHLSPSAFPALDSLIIRRTTSTCIVSLLDCMTTTPLTMLEIGIVDGGITAEIHSLYHALATHPTARTTLTYFSHRMWRKSVTTVDGPAGRISSDALLRLCALSNLTYLEIQSPGGFDIDNNTLANIARALPLLERLFFDVEGVASAAQSRVTLGALRHLAQYCPSLGVLQLTFDATTDPPPLEGIVNRSLTTLFVDHSHITSTSVSAVAQFLTELFPKVAIDEDKAPPSTIWEQVRAQMTRLEERRGRD